MKQIHIRPNVPLYAALVDPAGQYDFELQTGRYETTSGELLNLPRAAVIALNACEPQPGEEIQITKVWTGKPGELAEWTICLSTRAENDRAKAESEAQDLTGVLQASIERVNARKAATELPTPIRSTRRKPVAPEVQQPRLFDRRGTGTHGPEPDPRLSLPLPAVAIGRPLRIQIPANIAVKEILQFIAADPNTQNWSDQARQDLASTVIIAAYKAGQVGLWERGE